MIFPKQLLQDFQKLMDDELKKSAAEFQYRIIFMSMYNDIDWTMKNINDTCLQNPSRVSEYARSFPMGRWTFLGPENEMSGTGHTHTNRTANGIILQN